MHPPVKTFFRLEMLDVADLKPKHSPSADVEIRKVGQPAPEYNWFFHEVIGARYNWGGRADWTLGDWQRFAERAVLETWVAYWLDAPAGYFEIETQRDGSQRILCFGLLEAFIGKGLGGHLLTKCVERCWEREANRIWLRTCTHDHPHALANYKSRGFKVVETYCGARVEPTRTPRLPID